VNGKTSPDTIVFVAGRTYRVRLIDISANEAQRFELRGPRGVATWRQLARDGKDLPLDQQGMVPARFITAAGLTMDYELTLAETGDYALALTPVVGGQPVARTTLLVPVRVQER
jgi:hypothetical protein